MDEADPQASERKLRAKRHNERLKLAASALNTIFLAVVGAAFVVPAMGGLDQVRWVWLPPAFALHVLAQLALGFLKSEE